MNRDRSGKTNSIFMFLSISEFRSVKALTVTSWLGHKLGGPECLLKVLWTLLGGCSASSSCREVKGSPKRGARQPRLSCPVSGPSRCSSSI